MRLWYFSSSINSFFKCACAAIQWARCLIFGWTLRLLPYFMCVNSESSSEIARMCKLARAFAGHLCDKYHNLMSWLKYTCFEKKDLVFIVNINQYSYTCTCITFFICKHMCARSEKTDLHFNVLKFVSHD